MKSPTGAAIVAAINQILDLQTFEAQQEKHGESIRVLGSFAEKYGVSPQAGAFSTLSRLLRKLGRDQEAVRQIRSMSDSLLNKDEQDLEDELYQLRDQLMPIEARIHQVKTKTAFVYTVLRPFSEKYRVSWFPGRNDIDVDQVNAQIMRLENAPIEGVNDIANWAIEVADLFEQVVVYRGEDVADFYSRPSGTVSEKSSRTYLQAWAAFIDKYKDEIWEFVLNPEVSAKLGGSRHRSSYSAKEAFGRSVARSAPQNQRPGFDQDVPEIVQENISIMSAPYISESKSRKPERSETRSSFRSSSTKTARSDNWIEIFIESKLDPAAQATRRWESNSDFRNSIQKWLDTLPVIWGSAADQFVAKVSVKSNTGQSDLTLPSLTVKDAAKRLTQAVEMQDG
jgi:ribosomal protein L29